MTGSLYERAGEDGHAPFLLGGSCSQCGYNFFPMQDYGCEQCGSTELVEQKFAARGTLACHAVVYVHPDPKLSPPFTIGSIDLEDGITVRAIIEEAPDEVLRIGEPVIGFIVTKANSECSALDLRFKRAEVGA